MLYIWVNKINSTDDLVLSAALRTPGASDKAWCEIFNKSNLGVKVLECIIRASKETGKMVELTIHIENGVDGSAEVLRQVDLLVVPSRKIKLPVGATTILFNKDVRVYIDTGTSTIISCYKMEDSVYIVGLDVFDYATRGLVSHINDMIAPRMSPEAKLFIDMEPELGYGRPWILADIRKHACCDVHEAPPARSPGTYQTRENFNKVMEMVAAGKVFVAREIAESRKELVEKLESQLSNPQERGDFRRAFVGAVSVALLF